MELFESDINPVINLLPRDGEVHYYGNVIKLSKANSFLKELLNDIAWQHDETIIYGKHIVTKRKVAWYGDKPFEYTYSKMTKKGLAWTGALLEIKSVIECETGEKFNACLLNLYHNGSEGMSWHSDNEQELVSNAAIASLSLGAERRFDFKHKVTKQKVQLNLGHGSLLVMKGETQKHWLHQLPTTTKVTMPRINLTFRLIEDLM